MGGARVNTYLERYDVVWIAGFRQNKKNLYTEKYISLVENTKIEEICEIILSEIDSGQKSEGFLLKILGHLILGLSNVYHCQVIEGLRE